MEVSTSAATSNLALTKHPHKLRPVRNSIVLTTQEKTVGIAQEVLAFPFLPPATKPRIGTPNYKIPPRPELSTPTNLAPGKTSDTFRIIEPERPNTPILAKNRLKKGLLKPQAQHPKNRKEESPTSVRGPISQSDTRLRPGHQQWRTPLDQTSMYDSAANTPEKPCVTYRDQSETQVVTYPNLNPSKQNKPTSSDILSSTIKESYFKQLK